MSELKDMVDKRLGFGMVFRHVESGNQGFFHQFKVCVAVEFGIEGQERPGTFQTIACHFELVSIVHVLYAEFGDWALYASDI